LANHKSAIKRHRQSEDRRLRNRKVKTRVKNVVKDVKQAVSQSAGEDVTAKLTTAQSVIDKAAKKGVIHKRTASRKISRLARKAAAPTS